MLEGLVSVLLGYVTERYRPCEVYPAETQLMSNIIEWLDHNYTQTITLQFVAKNFGFGKYHFSRLFNKLFGCNFTVYVNRLRARYVRENAGKGKSVTALIYEAGFGCASAYYQFLKREKIV
ncbi:MAG: AraC family transcriptional regulator [Candidatus Borkfalkiaceae bacterium]|nr:AraC family transcriptional regulator [Christensenellaceae bacterium]